MIGWSPESFMLQCTADSSCVPRPVSVKAEWVMQKLREDGLGSQRSFGEMRKARGVDIRNERPSSAELEQVHEEPEGSVTVEDLKGEAEYGPYPQAPPTVPGTPLPGTPVPGTPVPATPRRVPERPEGVSEVLKSSRTAASLVGSRRLASAAGRGSSC